jgi:hypothetical protein
MKKNISPMDRFIRLLLVALALILYFTNTVTGTAGIILMAVAAIILLTTLVNFCPIYYVLGIRTNKVKS